MTSLLLAAILAYQHWVSPAVAPPCRYVPTCSHYASEAVGRFGWRHGSWLALRRLSRCTPWGGYGYDPVPSLPSPSTGEGRDGGEAHSHLLHLDYLTSSATSGRERGEEAASGGHAVNGVGKRRPAKRLHHLAVGALVGLMMVLVLAACVPGQQKPASGWSGAGLAGDVLFVGTMEGRVLALEAKPDARNRSWVFPPAGEKDLVAIYSTPLVVQDRVYFGDFSGKVFALEAASGSKVWEFNTGAPVFASMAQADGIVIAATAQGKVFALAADTGEPRWTFDKPTAGAWGTPAVSDGKVFVPSLDHNLYALELATGRLVWTFTGAGALAADPLVADGVVYQGSFAQRLYAISAQDGKALREFEGDGWFWSRPVLEGGTLYAATLGSRLYAWDAATGVQKWSFNTRAPVRATPALTGDTVVLANEKGAVFGVNRPTGVEKWTTTTGNGVVAPLSSRDNTVYLSALDHTIYSLDARNGQKLWSWNTSVSEK